MERAGNSSIRNVRASAFRGSLICPVCEVVPAPTVAGSSDPFAPGAVHRCLLLRSLAVEDVNDRALRGTFGGRRTTNRAQTIAHATKREMKASICRVSRFTSTTHHGKKQASARTRRTKVASSVAAPEVDPKQAITSVRVEDGHYTAESSIEIPMQADRLFDILLDYENCHNVFRNILDSQIKADENGNKQVLQTCSWTFMLFQGSFDTLFDVMEDATKRTIRFEACDSGFMGRFEVEWAVHELGEEQTRADYRLIVKPSLLPPPPVQKFTDKIFRKQVDHLVEDLCAEVDRQLRTST